MAKGKGLWGCKLEFISNLGVEVRVEKEDRPWKCIDDENTSLEFLQGEEI